MRVWSNLNKQRRDATGVVLKEQYAENSPFLDVPVFVFIHFYFRPFNLNMCSVLIGRSFAIRQKLTWSFGLRIGPG